MQKNTISAAEVARGLAGRAPELVRELLPNGRKMGNEWVCGSLAGEPGRSLSVRLNGGKAGVWSDFSSTESGDALDVVACVLFGCDRKAAYRWGLSWLGYGGSAPEVEQRRQVDRQRAAEREREEAEERQRKIGRARALFGSAARLHPDDPVVAYLAGRGIRLSPERFPASIRYHEAVWCHERDRFLNAMVGAILSLSGELIGVHITYLEWRDGGWKKARLQTAKRMMGSFSGGFIPLARGDSGRQLRAIEPTEELIIGEGVETCLSVAVCCPEYRVLCACSLYNMGRVVLPDAVGRVLLLADNDEGNAAAQAAFRKAVAAWKQKGVRVREARAPVGKDFNDTLAALGAS
ncbi:DUF7146 domain-containing protein [Bombella apis]|uniref:DUF7146 domain-containing protein n=1 Tax=Bombella apis TaxID=1785988 RepID=UPI0024A92074|nr:toprim domain-containing protein [Bombella apis]